MKKPKYETQIDMRAPVVDKTDVTTKGYVDGCIEALVDAGETRAPGKYVGKVVGDGEATEFIVTHNLGTRNVGVFVYDADNQRVYFEETSESINTIKLASVAPVEDGTEYVVIVLGVIA